MHRHLLALAACCLTAVACTRSPSPAPAAVASPAAAVPPQPPSADTASKADIDKGTTPEEAPPSDARAMQLIYGVDGEGATEYLIDHGRTATFWFAYRFELAGTTYHTVFAFNTPRRSEADAEAVLAAPDAKVTLTQATFRLAKPGTSEPWTFEQVELSIGEFGAFEKGDEVDEDRVAMSREISEGRLLLAVPTRSFDSGVNSYGYALLSFDPAHDSAGRTRWRYLGSVPAGSDNALQCEEGRVMPCHASSGTLSFGQPEASGFPPLTVSMQGTQIEASEKTRQLGAGDAVVYRFNSTSTAYEPAAARRL